MRNTPTVLAAMLFAVATSVFAQAWPSKPVTFIVPFAPGGILGTDVVAKAKPDGYTLLIANVGITSINPADADLKRYGRIIREQGLKAE